MTRPNYKKLLTEARRLLKRIEWAGDFCDGPCCPECLRAPHQGHTAKCVLGALVRGENV